MSTTTARTIIAHAYKTKSNYERAAGREIERQGTAVIIPVDESGDRLKITAPGYVFPERHVDRSYTRHVGHYLGPVYVDLLNLDVRKPPPPPKAPALQVGEAVRIVSGAGAGREGVLVKKRGRRQWIVEIDGRTVSAQTQSLIRIDPG